MSKNARLPYERMMVMLAQLETERIVVRTPDGVHRRLPVFTWGLATGQVKRTSYGGAEALLAMQAAARSRLMECRV